MVGLSAGRVEHGKGQGRVFTDWSRSLESVEPEPVWKGWPPAGSCLMGIAAMGSPG
jgi:hypothetical protein